MPGNQEVFQKSMSQGHSAAWDQMWETAAEFYQKALEEFPDHPAALTSLGLAFFEQKKYEAAFKYYQKAAKISPSDPVPFEKIARIFERQGKLTEAMQASIQAAELYLKTRDAEKSIECWQKAISLQPDHLMARTRLAMVFERMGRKAEAVTEYLATASIMQHNGDPQKSMQVAEYCLQIYPDSEESKQAISLLKKNMPLPKPSRVRGGTAPVRMSEVRQFQAPPDNLDKPQDPISEARQKALVKLAALLFEQAEDMPTSMTGSLGKRGISAITKATGSLAFNNADQTRVLIHLGQAIDSQTHGDDTQTAEELERALDAGLAHPAAYFDLGSIYAAQKNSKAQRFLQKALPHPDYALAANLLIAQIYEQAENYADAAPAYLRTLALADAALVPPDQADELKQLYEPIIETQVKQTDEPALKKLCANIAGQVMRPDWRDYLRIARQQLPMQSPGSPPLPLAELLLETGSSQVIEALSLIRDLASRNKLKTAMEETFYALELAPTYLPLHTQLGELLLQEGRTQEAMQKFLLVAHLYELRGETSQAVRLLSRVAQMAPMDLTIRKRLVELLTNQGKTQEAIQQTINLANTHYQLAELDQARGVFSDALRLAQQSKVERSLLVQILYKIADIDMQRLDMRQALRIYEQIRTLEPNDANGRTQLVDLNFRLGQDNAALNEVDGFVSLLENSGKRSAAIEFLNGLITDRPEKLELRKRLADVYVHSGRVVEAVQQLDAIADALLNIGNPAGAAQMFKAIIALNPPNLGQYKAALSQISRNIPGQENG